MPQTRDELVGNRTSGNPTRTVSALLEESLQSTDSLLDSVLSGHHPTIGVSEIGVVSTVLEGVVQADGLPGVRSEELLLLANGTMGMAFNLDETQVGIILLGSSQGLRAGTEVSRTGRVVDVPVGTALLGRVVSGVGVPLDGLGPLPQGERWAVEQDAPSIMERAPVSVPLQTGIKVVDALVPIGRGQRQLILGDRHTGKTAVALDTIINQHDGDMVCVYCHIGQRADSVAKLVASLQEHDAMKYSVIVVAGGDDAPGLQYIAPYAATTIGEYFMQQGRDVLVVYDDLTSHARAYRELSLLLRRPPGREAFPGGIFYIHSRLLERSTNRKPELGGGSLTALAIIETEAESLSAYIPTNLISITDGQIYLSPKLFQRGILPAVDVGKSVSRVGGQAQLAAFRAITGELRLAYSQFEELEAFSRFGTRLEEDTRATLERGRRVREVLKQPQYAPLPVLEQVALLLSAGQGVFDRVPLTLMDAAENAVRRDAARELGEVGERIRTGAPLSDDDFEAINRLAGTAVTALMVSDDAGHD